MKKAITIFLKFGTLISTYGLIVSVLIQIFARFLLPNAPAWTEEAARLFFIYAVAFSAGLAVESQDYVHLDWIFDKLPKKLQAYLLVLIAILTLVLFAIMAFYAIPFILMGHQETAPGMSIRMSYVFFSMFILAGSLTYFLKLGLLQELKKSKS